MYSHNVSTNLNYKLKFSYESNNLNNYSRNDKKKIYKKILNLNNNLNEEKNKINKYYENNCILWDKLKKFSNEYEFVYSSCFSTIERYMINQGKLK